MGKGRRGTAKVVAEWALGVQEASGLSPLGGGAFLVVDDEKGIFRCASEGDPIRLEAGAALADLEGICLSDDGGSAFVLSERDGGVWRFALADGALGHGTRLGKLTELNDRKNAGWEGIAFAAAGTFAANAELVAVHQKKPRRVGFFDAETLEPRLTLRLPKAARKGLSDLNDIIIDPTTQRLLVLSGKGGAIGELAVIDDELELVRLYELEHEKHDIPEGITIDDEGRIFVCTDGEGMLWEVVLED
jgi:uncharacterized protein YjiK